MTPRPPVQVDAPAPPSAPARAPALAPPSAPAGQSRPATRRRMILAAGAVISAVAAVDYLTGPRINFATLYLPVLFVCWWARDRLTLWLLVAVSVAATFGVYKLEHGDGRSLVNRTLSTAALLSSAALFHYLIGLWGQLESARRSLQGHVTELETLNRDLSARDQAIARQNEALRDVNEDLSARERTLEALLSLSRALTAELPRGQVVERLGEALGHLLSGPAAASAILEQDGDQLLVRCHNGFGPAGLRTDRVPLARSFASAVMTGGKTAYLEDVTRLPNVVLPQPNEGPEFVSVLAAPLRVRGWPVGVLELYSRERTAWPDAQVNLLESLAAQASVTLEAAHLFEGLERERRRVEAVLRTVPLGVAVADAGHRDVRLNPAGAAVLSLPADVNLATPEGLGGLQLFKGGEPVPPDERPLTRAAREGLETHAEEYEAARPGHKPVSLLMNARPIRGASGEVIGAVAAFVDITAQKELQRELDVRRREAEEASVRKTRFLAAVSHDVRTPANAISLLAELIRRTAGNPALAADIPELARELQQSATSLVNLLSDVLDVARFDSGRVEIQETEFPLSSLLAEEARQMQPLAREKNLALEVKPPEQSVRLRADRIKLGRVLGNLLGNAIKFTDAGGVRVAAAWGADGSVAIRVSDTGHGIAPEHQRHIFDEFFQLRNPERDRNKGTGLGLTICKRLVDAMGGRLEVQSTPGEGSVFTVTLPASAVVPHATGG